MSKSVGTKLGEGHGRRLKIAMRLAACLAVISLTIEYGFHDLSCCFALVAPY
jgi:hypothetical protein